MAQVVIMRADDYGGRRSVVQDADDIMTRAFFLCEPDFQLYVQ
jgi:hypothetical protein